MNFSTRPNGAIEPRQRRACTETDAANAAIQRAGIAEGRRTAIESCPAHLPQARGMSDLVRLFVLTVIVAMSGSAVGQDLESGQADSARIARWRQVLSAPAPRAGSPAELVKQYLARITAARSLDLPERELSEIESGLRAVGPQETAAYALYNRLAEFQNDRGDFLAGVRAREQALKLASTRTQELFQLSYLSSSYGALIQRRPALDALSRAREVLRALRSNPDWNRFGDLWQTRVSFASAHYEYLYGTVRNAEESSRSCIGTIRSYLGSTPDAADGDFYLLTACTERLLRILLRLGRLEEAATLSVELRELTRDYATKQRRPSFVARMAPVFALVSIERGRLHEAIVEIDAAIDRLRAAKSGEGSIHISQLQLLRGSIEMMRGNWLAADETFLARQKALLENREQARLLGTQLPEWSYAILKLGNSAKALEMAARVAKARETWLGTDTLPTWEARGFHAVSLAANGQRDEALKVFTSAVPRIIELADGERASQESGVLRATRLNWILESYLALLADVARGVEKSAGIDPVDEAFRVADLIRGSKVQRALAMAASRAVMPQGDLAELARRYHDRQREMGSLSDALANLLGRARVASTDTVAMDIRHELNNLRNEQTRLKDEIDRRFPNYASLIDPRPPGIREIQRLLRPGEALLSTLTSGGRVFLWGIPQTGHRVFASQVVDENKLARQIERLRRSVDPNNVAPGGLIPHYDFDDAHSLYRQFVAPLEPALRGARSVIVVTSGPLTRVPFSILTMASFAPPASAPSFDEYVEAPWLIQRFALSSSPSTTALLALRRNGITRHADRPFIGFANPSFSVQAKEVPVRSGSFLPRKPALAARPSGGAADPSVISRLSPLPETEAEVLEIAKILGAETPRDVFLRERASESNVKSTDLTPYRILMFATHGVMPGEVPGLSQPALAMSNPALVGGTDDGWLMLDEILGLRLQADWVVLSACNTAAADDAGGEALSGLGRAFFVAGARALLVTGWPVETRSAQLLTTELFRVKSHETRRSSAEALRQAMLALMRMQYDGTTRVGYGHPMFWAPYQLVGDGD